MQTKHWDIMPPAKTNLEDFRNWQNRWQAELIPQLSIAKKIDVYFMTEEDIFEELREQALNEVCGCFRDYVLGHTGTEPDTDDLNGLINESPYFMHYQAGEDWNDCPEWAQDRAEHFADMQIMEMRGK